MNASEKAIRRKVLLRVPIVSVITAACLFGCAGTLAWWNAWVFLGAYVVVMVLLTEGVFKRAPDLVAERLSAAKTAKAWDRILVPVLAGLLPVTMILIAGLDRRFGWTRSITAVQSILALVVALGATALILWAMRVNRFFSSHVRIQTDRGHVVVSDGPYAYVRHPGYAGTIIYNLAAPILLGSLPALWIGVLMLVLFVVRTALEDRTLRSELAGYEEYAGRVRYRLLPLVW